MRGKHFQLNKIMSVVMAAAMTLSGVGSNVVMAEDVKKDDFFYVEERGQPGTYYLKLPYYETDFTNIQHSLEEYNISVKAVCYMLLQICSSQKIVQNQTCFSHSAS